MTTDDREEAPDASPRERRPNRSIADKLAELSASCRARIDKLEAREMRLVADLGRVRTDLSAARAELDKLRAAQGVTHAPGPEPVPEPEPEPERRAAARNGHDRHDADAPF